MSVVIEPMRQVDARGVLNIYGEGIAGGNSTFETEVPDWETWDQRHRPDCRLAARHEGFLVGWAALSPVSTRPVYRGVAEVSIYVTNTYHGMGIGKLLLKALIQAAESAGIWTLQASIFPENIASRALFLGCGFRLVGQRERIATLHGRWRDTILLERRIGGS